MKRKILAAVLAMIMILSSFTGCGADSGQGAAGSAESSVIKTDQVADASDMAEVEDVVEEGMTPVTGAQVKDGTYDVTVDSSSSMFRIEKCSLTVENGENARFEVFDFHLRFGFPFRCASLGMTKKKLPLEMTNCFLSSRPSKASGEISMNRQRREKRPSIGLTAKKKKIIRFSLI